MKVELNNNAERRQEELFTEQIKQQVENAAIGAERLKDKINEVKTNADRAIEEANKRAIDKETGRDPLAVEKLIAGSVTEQTTLKYQVKVTEIFIKEVINQYKNKPFLIPLPDSPGGRVLRQLVSQIQDPKSEISSMGASYLYRIVYKAINGQIANPLETLTKNELKHLKTVDSTLSLKVTKSLVEAARQSGIGETEIRKFEEDQKENEQKKNNGEIKSKIDELAGKYVETFDRLNGYVDSLSSIVEGRLREEVEKKVRKKHEGEKIPEEDLQREIKLETDDEMRLIRGMLKGLFSIYPTDADASARLLKYYQNLSELYAKGLLTQEEISKLQDLAKEWLSFAGEQRVTPMGTLEERAKYFGVEVASALGKNMLKALDNGYELKSLLESPEYQKVGKPGEIDFEKFYLHVKLLCEEVLSIATVHGNEWFDRAFNPMYASRFYEILVESARNRAIELSQQYPELANKKVEYNRVVLTADETQSTDRGKREIPQIRTYRKNLHEAIGDELVDKMTRWLKVYKFVHDGNKIIEEGLGFKTLAEYAEGLDVNDMDQMLYEDPELTVGYQAYMEGLRSEGYLHHRILQQSFGTKNEPGGLDRSQRKAYRRLLLMREKDNPDVKFQQWEKDQVKRKARFASGMAKLYVGDYWGFLRGVYLPMNLEPTEVTDKQGKKIIRYKFVRTWPSTGESGPERMAVSIDLEKSMIRFDIPGPQPNLPYVYQRRKLDRYEPWDHTKVYWFKEQKEDAVGQGASDEYLDFIKNQISLGEYNRLKVIGTIIRGDWRMEAFRGFIHYKEGNKFYNFYESIVDLKTVGSAALKVFLDKMEFKKVEMAVIKDVLGKGNLQPGPGLEKLVGKENYQRIAKMLNSGKSIEETINLNKEIFATAFRTRCYQEFLFGALFETHPTRVLALERRELTPKGEPTVIEDLWQCLLKEFKGQMSNDDIKLRLAPLFIEALELVQQEKAKTNEKDFLRAASQATDLTQFRQLLTKQALSETDFHDEKMRGMLSSLLKEYKDDVGQDISTKSDLYFLTEEKFLDILPQFFKVLKQSIYKPERKEGVEKGEKITLAERYTNWQNLGLDVVEDIGGDDLNFNKFFFQGGGKRMVARYITETYLISEQYTKNLRKFFEEGSIAITKAHFSNTEEFIKFVSEQIAAPLVEMRKAGVDIINWKKWGNEFCVRNIIFFDRLVSRDHQFRMLGLGGAALNWLRWMTKREGSIMQDSFRNFIDRPTNSLDADHSEALCRSLGNASEIPWGPENIAGSGYKEVGWGPLKLKVPNIEYEYEEQEIKIGPIKFKVKKPLYDERKIKIGPFTRTVKVPRLKEGSKYDWHAGLIKLSEGHLAELKIIDRYLPIAILAMLMLLLNLGWGAKKKDEKK